MMIEEQESLEIAEKEYTAEELTDLKQEIEDAQFAFDADWYNLITAQDHIKASYAKLQDYKNKLKTNETKNRMDRN